MSGMGTLYCISSYANTTGIKIYIAWHIIRLAIFNSSENTEQSLTLSGRSSINQATDCTPGEETARENRHGYKRMPQRTVQRIGSDRKNGTHNEAYLKARRHAQTLWTKAHASHAGGT